MSLFVLVFGNYSQVKKTIASKWRFIDVIRTKQVDDLLEIFPEMSKELLELQNKFYDIVKPLESHYNRLQQQLMEGTIDRKTFFIEIQKAVNYNAKLKTFLGIFTYLYDNIEASFDEAVMSLDSSRVLKSL